MPDSSPKYRLQQHELGYYEIAPKPSTEELRAHYNAKYYDYGPQAAGKSQYAYDYSADELLHKRIAADEAGSYFDGPVSGRRLLEIGYGEGFFCHHMHSAGWAVSGVDFTHDGLQRHFPELKEALSAGDAYQYLDYQLDAQSRYDLVVLNNVLEHVPDPMELMQRVRRLLTDTGLVRVTVPNDGSWLQQLIVAQGLAQPQYWLAPPEHLCYFTEPSLRALLHATGYQVRDTLGEFPVDLYLLNRNSNYEFDRAKGREAHFSRIRFELGLYGQSLQQLMVFRRGCAAVGIGRNLVAYAGAAT